MDASFAPFAVKRVSDRSKWTKKKAALFGAAFIFRRSRGEIT